MAKIPYKSYFPEKSDSKTIAALQAIVKQCEKKLADIQDQFHFDSLKLSAPDRTRLAEILVDFAFDLHTEAGIWVALEKYNTNLFGTPLPLIHPAGNDLQPGLCQERVQFLLWNFYPQFDPGSWYSPKHVDLLIAAEDITDWLNKQLPVFPKTSPIKDFLSGPNDYGWEIKKKLIWLGTRSYLFRVLFDQYFEDRYEEQHEIAVTDDFVCQNTTVWSGLGVIDILAECLDISDEQKSELRSWYMRHASIYKIVKTDDELTEAVNLVNDISYRIREGAPGSPRSKYFKPGITAFGSLVPWRNEWYWSGQQYDMTPYTKEQISLTVSQHKQKTQIVARFWPELKKKAFDRMEEEFQCSLKHYGSDLVVFPDGRTLEHEENKRLAAEMKARGFADRKMPRLSLPEHFRNGKTGIGIYLDPVEGMEMMEHFNKIRSGLKKNGNNCTPEEGNMLRIWLEDPSGNPDFIYRALKEYGGEESIKRAICWETDAPYWLDYLLRCQKGDYYRFRFPSISFVESGKD